jgi:hypothetical protein
MTYDTTNCIGAQGELRVYKIDALPEGLTFTPTNKDYNGAHILSHSEKGHNHVIDGDTQVMEHVAVVNGMTLRSFFALVEKTTALHQTATDNHLDIPLDPGVYAIRVDVEHDPFADQIREVRD